MRAGSRSGWAADAEVTVVGAGVIGLTTAIRLLEAGCHVRIVARDASPHTTSDVAAAVWYPFRVAPESRVVPWAAAAYQVFRALAARADAGVRMVEGVQPLAQSRRDDPPWAAAVEGFRRASEADLPSGYTDGWVFLAPVVQMTAFMPWLQAQAAALGATFETRALTDLASVDADVTVNCTGLGARDLVPDPAVVPVRGQVVRVAPGYAHRFIQETTGPNAIAYIIPRPDCTVLGGTADEGQWDTTVDDETAGAIVARCIRLEPRLRDAAVLSHAVGLRPYRPEVRLEAERRNGRLYVHNYGHGGAGVTTSWGCAAEVVSLVRGQMQGD